MRASGTRHRHPAEGRVETSKWDATPTPGRLPDASKWDADADARLMPPTAVSGMRHQHLDERPARRRHHDGMPHRPLGVRAVVAAAPQEARGGMRRRRLVVLTRRWKRSGRVALGMPRPLAEGRRRESLSLSLSLSLRAGEGGPMGCDSDARLFAAGGSRWDRHLPLGTPMV